MRTFIAICLLLTLSACLSTRPSNPSNVCHMFEERRSWYKAAQRTEDRWGVPVPVTMAFIHQESSFQSRARPDRTRLLWVIPWKRPSTARGYAQALDSTWADYQRETGNSRARRSSFADAVDFIGWYNAHSQRRSNIALYDARNLYLAYHDGHTGFNRGTWQDKPWLKEVAATVQSNADRYAAQYATCREDLGKSWFWRLFT
tara:strand:+ start:27570 stop:28175 length:606 start_codon:yes stop_codon:yes gene_type:complete